MSDLLFPRVKSRRVLELRLTVLAGVMLAGFGLFSLWLGASFVGLIGGDVVATARVVALGDSLGVNSAVKFRGLRVGRVVSVDNSRDGDGLYAASIIIDQEHADQIPADARARVLPGTLFGAEYVELKQPTPSEGRMTLVSASGTPMVADGDVFAADTSDESIRLMDTFSVLYRVIDAIDPEAVDLAMSQLASALDGRGDDLHDAVGRVRNLVDDFSAAEPTFYRDLDLLTENLEALDDVEPELIDTLENSLPLARTIAKRDREIEKLVDSGTVLSGDIGAFLAANGGTLGTMLDELAPTYRTFVGGRAPFTDILRLAPPVLNNGSTAVKGGAIQMDAKFSAQIRNPYSSADCPQYGELKGRNCP